MCALIPRHANPARIFVREIQAARFLPIHAEFVVMGAGGNVRMPAGHHVGINADRGGGPRAACFDMPRGFARQRVRIRLPIRY